MKTLIFTCLIGLTQIVGAKEIRSQQISDKKLVSFMNYQMPALDVQVSGNQVQVLIETAILEYADNRPMLDEKLNERLKDNFKLQKVDELIVTFNSDQCNQDEKNKDIFKCSGNAELQARGRDINGSSEQSAVTLGSYNTDIQTTLLSERNSSGQQYSTLKAYVNIDTLDINNEKSGLGRPL